MIKKSENISSEKPLIAMLFGKIKKKIIVKVTYLKSSKDY